MYSKPFVNGVIFSFTEYEITVITGDKIGAGTDANVYITIYGKNGQTAKLPLKSKTKNVFERNTSDIFTEKANCVGPLTKIRIEHDNTGAGPGWYLERVSACLYLRLNKLCHGDI